MQDTLAAHRGVRVSRTMCSTMRSPKIVTEKFMIQQAESKLVAMMIGSLDINQTLSLVIATTGMEENWSDEDWNNFLNDPYY